MSAPSRVLREFLPSFAYMALIWVLSSMPLQASVEFVPFHDKGVHFVEFGVLGALNARAVLRSWPGASRLKLLLGAFAITACWALLDEIHQAYVPNRNSDWRDVLADWIGAALAVVALGYLSARRAARRGGTGSRPTSARS